MGQIALTLPQSNLPNATEDPKIVSDFTLIQTLVNGNIDTNNLAAAAGITFAQLAAGAGRPNIVGITGNTTATSGNLYVVNSGNPLTITLPAPTQNALIGIFPFAATGAAPVTVTSPTNVIGLGLLASSFLLGASSSCVVLMGNSTTNWVMVSGQQDTGWVTMTLVNGWSAAAGFYVPAVRLVGDRVWMRGLAAAVAGGTPITTLASQFRPASTVAVGTSGLGTSVGYQISPAGVVGVGGSATSAPFDGLSYTLS